MLKNLPRGPKRRKFLKKIKKGFNGHYFAAMRRLFDYKTVGLKCVAKQLKRKNLTMEKLRKAKKRTLESIVRRAYGCLKW